VFETSKYFTGFLQEMQVYLDDLQAQAEALRNRPATDLQVRELRRLGHTITGLTATFELPDFAVLGVALNETVARFISHKRPISQMLSAPLSLCAHYMAQRLQRMRQAHSNLAPTRYEMNMAEQLAQDLTALAPPPLPNVSTTAIHRAIASPLDLSATLAAFSPQQQADIEMFLHAELSDCGASPMSDQDQEQELDREEVSPEIIGLFVSEMDETLEQMQVQVQALATTTEPVELIGLISEQAHKLKGAAATIHMHASSTICDMMMFLCKALIQRRIPLNNGVRLWLNTCVSQLGVLRAQIMDTQTEGDTTDLIEQLRIGYQRLFMAAPTRPRSLPPRDEEPPPRPSATGESDGVSHATGSHRAEVDVRRLDQIMRLLNNVLIHCIEVKRLQKQTVASNDELGRVIMRVTDLYDRLRAERADVTPLPPELRPVAPVSHRSGLPRPQSVAPFIVNGEQVELEHWSEFDHLMAMIGEAISDLRSLHLSLQMALTQIGNHRNQHDFLVETVQRDLMDLRMAPFSEMVMQLKTVAEATAQIEHKDVDFIVEGEEHELDRDIGAMIKEPLRVLVRNAIAHGIETSDERAEAGKLEPARVTMSVAYAGNALAIDVTDNGRGVSPQRIAAPLITKGRMTAEQARTLTVAQACELLFQRDLNDARKVRATAGHGVGLPSARRIVESIGGQLTATSVPGAGTTFHLRVPITLSALHAMAIHVGNNGFAIPTSDIQFTTLVKPESIRPTPNGARATITDLVNNEMEVPLITLADLLDHPEIPTVGTTAIIVTVQHERYAVVVDQIGDESDMVVRKVPHHMRRRGVRGATITRTGEVLLILSLPEMIESAVETGRFGKRAPAIAQPPPEQPQGDYILVVDDSLSIRRGVEHSLRQAGYTVMLARDGVEAIEQMTRARPRLVILDIEMPQLNGYEVLEVLRTHEPFRDVRAIVLTSRAAQRYRRQAEALGAAGYLAKPCPAETLLEAVKQALIV
jgi:chemotaxis protein histidine kinase CheA